MVFAFAGDSTTTTFMDPFDQGARARTFLSARRRSCQDDARPFRRVPVRAEAWRRRRLTSGAAAPVRQPRPVWVPTFRGSARTRRRYLRVRLQPAATTVVGQESTSPEPPVAAPPYAAAPRAATARPRQSRSESHRAAASRCTRAHADRAVSRA